jgi:disulfide bond formation protein DsbB
MERWRKLMSKSQRILFAWVVSIIATLGSLYFSEIVGYIPCKFCWFQRILMYPLVIILGVGYYKGELGIKHYGLPFSIIGMFVSAIHYLHQKTDIFDQVVKCTDGVPCSGEYINWLNFITIPFLAFTAFTIITVLLFYKTSEETKDE